MKRDKCSQLTFFLRVLRKRRFLTFFSGGVYPWGHRYFLSTLWGSRRFFFGSSSSGGSSSSRTISIYLCKKCNVIKLLLKSTCPPTPSDTIALFFFFFFFFLWYTYGNFFSLLLNTIAISSLSLSLSLSFFFDIHSNTAQLTRNSIS